MDNRYDIVSETTLPGATVRRVGLWAGPLLAALVWWALPAAYRDASGGLAELSPAGRATAALAVWMAVWWMTEAISLYATALLPLAILPLFGAGSAREAATPYGNELIFLYVGGFLLALSMQRWGLDRRIAFGVIRLMGMRATFLTLGFMVVTAVLSMWLSNVAATLVFYPVIISILTVAQEGQEGSPHTGLPEVEFRNLAHCLLLGVAYAASIGGLGTLIGTAPNVFLASYVGTHLGIEITFAHWLMFGIPLVFVLLPLTWLVLIHVFPVRGLRLQGVEAVANNALKELGPMGRGERITLGVFSVAVTCWVFRPLLEMISVAGAYPLSGLTDSGIAIFAALVLFVLPAGRKGASVMDWETAKRLPFGLLLLFGGGLSLAAAITRNGTGDFIGSQMTFLQGYPVWLVVACVTLGVLLLTELTSNTATAATLIPIGAAVALGMGWDPLVLLVPVVLAASCAFMLPVATPPNAIVYGSGWVESKAMLRAGLWVNLIAMAVILGLAYFVVGRVFGE